MSAAGLLLRLVAIVVACARLVVRGYNISCLVCSTVTILLFYFLLRVYL